MDLFPITCNRRFLLTFHLLVFRLSTGAAVSITGSWQPSPSGKEQSYELHAQAVKVLGENDSAVRTLQDLPR
jgi:aspartyl/asparaginyl-tRNA synthetase